MALRIGWRVAVGGSVLGAMMAGAWSQAADAKPRRVNAPLAFHLACSKTEYIRTEPIQVTLSLEHNGKKPVWVNKRFAINAATLPAEDREVLIEITSPTGEPRTSTYSQPIGFPKSDDFVLLQPGQTVTAEHPRDLRGYFDFSALGTYTIVGIYENVFGEEVGLPAFRGPLKSPPVSITITESHP